MHPDSVERGLRRAICTKQKTRPRFAWLRGHVGRAGRSLDRRLVWNMTENSSGSQTAVEGPTRPTQSQSRLSQTGLD